VNPNNTILSITTSHGTACLELESFIHQVPSDTILIDDVIRHYDSFLDKLSIPRAKINELKKAKDQIVKQYIYATKAPFALDLTLLNYKALLFYFKDSFLKRSLVLKESHYSNDLTKIDSLRQPNFSNFFAITGELTIKLTHNNFPHLIGIRKPVDSHGNVINHNYIDEFLDDIFYETKVLEDYRSHRGDEHKIKTFSWIYATLQNPWVVFESDAIKTNRSNFDSDLVFVRKIYGSHEYKYHIVGLKVNDDEAIIMSQLSVMVNFTENLIKRRRFM